MSRTAHRHLVEVARPLSSALTEALLSSGPLALSRRNKNQPLAEVLCRAVAGQQLSTKAAATIWGRVLERAGDRDLVRYLGETDPLELRSAGLSNAKSKAVQAIAEAAQAGELDPDELRKLDRDARCQRLTTIWGVGDWTADMIDIFYFGNRDVWPDGDVAARKTLEKLTSRRRKTEKTAALFAPYRSYLALHMWHHCDGMPS